ncbi:MAG: response regulator [Bacteroidia bacterium]
MRALIIDDVANARQLLRADLEAHCPGIEVVGEADGVVEGAKQIRNLNPELVFLDVQMPDGSGFDLLDIIGDIHFHIIFTTASDAHAIQALRLSAIDYLLKTPRYGRIEGGSGKSPESRKIGSWGEGTQSQPSGWAACTHCPEFDGKNPYRTHPGHRKLRRQCGLHPDPFYRRKAASGDTYAKEFDELLQSHGFLRVHQSHVVNLVYVRTFLRADGGFLELSTGGKIPVSSRKRSQVISHLQNLGIHSS